MKVIVFFALFVSSLAWSSENIECGKSCTFVLKNHKEATYSIINESRADVRITPFSTFKVPNTLIALDTGVVHSLVQELTFDHLKYPAQSWWPSIWYDKPLPIRAAFQNSAVPIYRQLAIQIGEERMSQYLSKFDYGNRDISSGLDKFWLNGSLKISAREQVDFLQKLFSGSLPVSQETLSLFKEVMLVEETDSYKLYAKSGGGQISDDFAQGWYVGVVETGNNMYFFAANIDGKNFAEIQTKRIRFTRQHLSRLGVI
ncbi:penicillin-binding transpeptidase domain-containing protein [Microbulbifer variabilis]|uniref:penicillin-binding transpeptidase domain-containing protein n=1 Tax=Microbulbifer variabilis TaxID=266805 RepID=UPI001CFE7AAC|nr:penicillin-binding transpeptidase domain-containing protein [Microbulbifer variabilis]